MYWRHEQIVRAGTGLSTHYLIIIVFCTLDALQAVTPFHDGRRPRTHEKPVGSSCQRHSAQEPRIEVCTLKLA